MDSYTFGSDEGMRALVAAYATDTEVRRADGYELDLGSATDCLGLFTALADYARGSTVDSVQLRSCASDILHTAAQRFRTAADAAAIVAVVESGRHYSACWSRTEFTTVVYALREFALGSAEDLTRAGDDHPVNAAWSLLSGIAETVSIEFV